MNAIITFKTLKSKKTGQDFETLELKAGKYTTIIFPTELEKYYLKEYIKKSAHDAFQDGEELSEKPKAKEE